MQNAEEADLGTYVLGIGCNLQERLCTGLEEQLEDDFLVLPNERGQRVWHAEHQVIVVYWQQLLLASGQPLIAGVGLALRAMSVSAGVVRDGLMAAAIALVAVS